MISARRSRSKNHSSNSRNNSMVRAMSDRSIGLNSQDAPRDIYEEGTDYVGDLWTGNHHRGASTASQLARERRSTGYAMGQKSGGNNGPWSATQANFPRNVPNFASETALGYDAHKVGLRRASSTGAPANAWENLMSTSDLPLAQQRQLSDPLSPTLSRHRTEPSRPPLHGTQECSATGTTTGSTLYVSEFEHEHAKSV